ncbi:MAG: hypothetical protein CMP10_21535 [Zetaproteobacteria bacterium]|nr:hypothetical protein [Pseudobdellovibrionaceae bacterium]
MNVMKRCATMLIFSIFLLPANISWAKKGDISISYHLGEALSASNARFEYKGFTLGIDMRGGGLYSGGNLWKGHNYAGAGVYLSQSIGMCAYIGREWALSIGRIYTEFWSIGTVNGRTYALVNLGIGIAI